RDVGHPRLLELLREVARQLDAVRHERRLEAEPRRLAHDRDELLAVAERRVASGDLDADAVAVLVAHSLEALEDELDRDVFDLLRRLREVAERAVEVAALRDLDRHASDRIPPPDRLRRDLELRIEASIGRVEPGVTSREIVEDR